MAMFGSFLVQDLVWVQRLPEQGVHCGDEAENQALLMF